jgi:hypothetical protein
MGSQKTETTSRQETKTQLAPRSAQEQQLLDALSSLTKGAGSQLDLDALGRLASGEGLQPTAEDRRLTEESFGLTNQMAERALEDFVREQNLGLDEQLSARGMQGSSIEAVNRGLVRRDAGRQLADILDQSRREQAQSLMQLPFQRAGMQLNANQQLFNQIIGGAQPALRFGLNERIADIDTTGFGEQTETMQPSFVDYMNAGANLAKAVRPTPD